MLKLLLQLFIGSLAVLVAVEVLPGITVDSWLTLLVVVIVFGVINAVIKPAIVLLTLPISAITFGLFLLVINSGLVMLTAWLVPGFEVSSWLAALLFSFTVSLVGGVLNTVTK